MRNTSDPIKENSNVMNAQGGDKKVMKKILSVALSTAMAFSMFASVAFGDTAVTPQQQFDALKAKGIFTGYPDGSAGLDKEMTRAEFAKVITKLLGLKEITGTLSYTDKNYTAKNWAVPYIEAVTAAGIMEGKNVEKKIFDFNGKVTVAEMATILTRALDLEIPTETNNNAAAWAKGYVQAAINAGLIDANANFAGNASRELLVGAAYSIDQAQSLKVESYTVTEAGKVVEFKISDGETVKVTLDKALEANKETEVKFTYKDKEFTEKVTYVVTTATKVESVTATNLKEITVNFDGSVDETSAEQVALYSVVRDITGANANSIEKATVSADKKSVVLTLTNALINNTAYKLSATGVKTGGTAAVTTKDVKFTTSDVAAPTVEKVEALGNSAVKVTFSEPVNINNKSAASNYFEIDGKVVSGTLDVNGNTVIIKSFTKLANGDHKIVTKKAIQDYAGYPVLEKTFDFTVAEDTTAPTIAGVSNVTFEAATVTFSEDVDPSTVSGSNVYWLDGSQKRYADSGYEKQIDGKTFKFTFSGLKKLPSYATDLYINGVKDYSGNQIVADSKTTVNAVIDQTRPEVASFTFNNNTNKSAVLKFTKAVDTSTFAAKNVVVKNSDGKVVTNIFTPAWSDSNKTLTINFANALDAGTYSFELTGLKDATTLANSMLPYTGEITVGEIAQPKLVSTVKGASSFILNFDKKMALDGEGSILNPANFYATYTVDGNEITGQLPAGTTYETLADQKSVLIKLPSGVVVTKLNVQGVRSAAGNVLSGYVADALANSVATFTVTEAKAIATNEIVLKLNQPAASAVKESFKVTVAGTVVPTTDAWVDSADNTLVHIKVADNTLDAAVTNVKVDVNANTGSQSIAGSPIVAGTQVSVKDAVKASIVKNADDKIVITAGTANVPTTGIVFNAATNKIWVNFTEDIQAANKDVAGQLFKVTQSDGTALVYGTDYTATITGPTVELSLIPTGSKVSGYNGIYRVTLNNDSKYITDKATGLDFDGSTPLTNAVSNFNVEDDAVNNNAIVINNAVTATATFSTTVAEEVTVSFNKAVDPSTLVAANFVSSVGGVVTNVEAATDNKSVKVTYTSPLTAGDTVEVTNVKDAAGNILAPVTFTK
ncbi:hypothetical protein BK131_17410 [Paenibacillus amylolyticus]|uniref:SLH domain-containing protein n=1 Tax=Paenibacillus amylolyticus TaxID=1451 RepID=A0A1R1BT24_PAEAM|nr:Ig-like domain-containing protein [Paenibacillus amylolyticus]OMF13016.1 hypothetical protein BK131_17410 [Paenibacillus amylolyticus]